jgi:preprotein translocase subunit SecF
MSRLGSLGARLYNGEVSYDFVGRRRTWYIISGVILVLAAVGLFGRGLNYGIEFKGGAEFVTPSVSCTVTSATEAVEAAGVRPRRHGAGHRQDPRHHQAADRQRVGRRHQRAGQGLRHRHQRHRRLRGRPSWGADITEKAVQGLVIFLLLVVLFLRSTSSGAWRPALIALAHDLVITVGIYALVGFEVTPATVIGILTILGYSLYDTVVVFDKVKENTRGIAGQSKITYSQAANLALNQTLVRSINTSIVALLPVLSILTIGVYLLGAGTLKDLALALFVGMLAGTYSSIFIATPVLAQLKERQPEMKAVARRVAAKGGTGRAS